MSSINSREVVQATAVNTSAASDTAQITDVAVSPRADAAARSRPGARTASLRTCIEPGIGRTRREC